MRGRITALALALTSALLWAQPQDPPQPETPRFRAGTNLVRLDVYASREGVSVANLTAEDFEVFEDNAPQRVEAFEFVKPRPPVPQEMRDEPRSLRQSQEMAADPAARLFVLLYDLQNVSITGAYHANKAVFEFLNKVIGQDDMVGVMTSDMSPLALTFARRTLALEKYFSANWAWGERDRLITSDPVEEALKDCYPTLRDRPRNSGDPTVSEPSGVGPLADLISRHREKKTLDTLDGLVTHLGGIREERKFVLVFTEGWRLHEPDQRSAGIIDDQVPTGGRVGVEPDGRLSTRPPAGYADMSSCEQQRVMLAQLDNNREFQEIMQRANRANVSFYPVDARGLQVYDERYQFNRNQVVATQTNARREALYRMAEATDGIAVVNVNDVRGGMARIVSDVSSYYLLSYYSTNSKMDGRFRRIRVRIKQQGVVARARPGYLAPTEAEARAGMPAAAGSAPAKAAPPEAVVRALGQIDSSKPSAAVKAFRRGPSTGLAYQPSADARFRRTERVRIEFPVAEGATLSARLLTRQGQAMALAVDTSTRTADTGEWLGVANLVLAPLAPGEYVIEVVATAGDSATTHYGFRIVP